MKLTAISSCHPVLTTLLVLFPLIASAQEDQPPAAWSFSVSLGIASTPAYLGDDEQQVSVFPEFSASYGDRFFASILGGVGYNLISTQVWRAGPIAQLNLGRYEDGENPLLVAGDESDDLLGLGDIDPSVMVGGFVEYNYQRLQGKLGIKKDTGGHDGLVADVQLKLGHSGQLFGKPAVFSIGPEVAWGDDDYMSAFFGVDADQSINSGLSEFDASGGVVFYGLHATVYVPVDQHWFLTGFAGYNRIVSEQESGDTEIS